MSRHTICLDLGTINTLIYVKSSNSIVFNEPTVIALDSNSGEVVEIGYLAAKMVGRAPYNVRVLYPLKAGVVADLDATIKFVNQALKNLKLKSIMKGSTVYLASPSNITPVEQQALVDVVAKMGAKRVIVDAEAKMAAIGSGIDIFSPRGSMVIDIGGGTTDVAVIALGEIVRTKATNIAGNAFNQAIMKLLRSKHHLVVGEKTAEYIKMKIGSVTTKPDNQLLEVNGRDLVSGLPRSIILSSVELSECLISLVDDIADLVIEVLEETPAELSADIVYSGLTLCGGGSLLSGLREYFEKRLSIPVHLTPYPLETVINGLIAVASENKGK